MIYTSVPHIYEVIDETRSRVLYRVEGLSEEQLTARPSPDAWSVAEIVEHLAKIEHSLLRVMKLMLMKAEGADTASNDAPVKMRPFSLDEFIERASTEKYTAPETVRPGGEESVSESLSKLKATREELRGLGPRLEARDLSGVTFPHPAFGPLNLYQWLAFIGIHEARHLKQIEAALSS